MMKMDKLHKIIFSLLCFLVFSVNCYMVTSISHATNIMYIISTGLGSSLFSIFLWSVIGIVLANIGLFFYKIVRPTDDKVLDNWQKYSIGLTAAIILKPTLGII